MERWTISKKIFFVITVISLIFILLATCCFGYIYVTNNTAGTLSDKKNESVILSKSVDSWIMKNESVMMQMFYDKNFASICSSGGDAMYYLQMDEYLRGFYAVNDGMYAISFMDNAGRKSMISNLGYSQMNSLIETYYDMAQDEPDGYIWDVVSTPDGNKIIFARQIWQLDINLKKISYGVVMFMIDEEEIYSFYKGTEPVYNSRIYIMGENGKILSSGLREHTGRQFTELYKENGNMLEDADGSKYYMISTAQEKADWHVVIVVPRSDVMGGLYAAMQSMWLIMIILLALALAAAVVTARSIEGPINILADSLDDIIKNNFSAKLDIKTDKTTRHLVDSYNEMLDRLNELINQNLRMEIWNKKAQLEAYEMQINPHFIYNTLDMIRMMAVMDDSENIDEAVICLSSLLRFNNRIEKEILISEEIESIEYYFRILKLRYGDDFDYEIDVPEEIMNYYTLKFLLQPIAENAVKHGLERSDRKGYIKVMARQMKEEIILLIKDNGAGISSDRLRELKDSLKNSDSYNMQDKNIGMINVYQRIRLFYGNDFGLDIESSENEKTVVSIHIPVRKEKDEQEKE